MSQGLTSSVRRMVIGVGRHKHKGCTASGLKPTPSFDRNDCFVCTGEADMVPASSTGWGYLCRVDQAVKGHIIYARSEQDPGLGEMSQSPEMRGTAALMLFEEVE